MNVIVSLLIIATVCLQTAAASTTGVSGEARRDAARPQPLFSAHEAPRKPQAGFEANTGQMDPRVRFVSRLGDRTAFVTATALVVTSTAGTERTVFNGPGGTGRVEPAGRRIGTANWFLGDEPVLWRRGAAVHEAVALRDVAPGVDVVVSATSAGVRWELLAQSGADVLALRVEHDGSPIRAAAVQQGPNGSRPLPAGLVQGEDGAWFVRHGAVEPGAALRVIADTAEVELDASSTERGGFVVRPTTSTFLGGTESDVILDVAVDPEGAPWVAGYTYSADFPTESPLQGFQAGFGDAMVAKLAVGGLGLFESTYFGGSDYDAAYAVGFDVYGGVVIAGYSASPDLPTVSAFQPTYRGSGDGFVARMRSDGSQIEFSTYVGGSSTDIIWGMATSPLGEIALAGTTASVDYPIVAPGNGPSGDWDGTLSVLTPGGELAHSTLVGGPFSDSLVDVVFDGRGSMYVTDKRGSPGGASWSIDQLSTSLVPGPSLDLGLNPSLLPELYGLARGPSGIVAAGTVAQAGLRKDRGGGPITDVLIVKVPYDLSSVQHRTHGGSGTDAASDVAVDLEGRIFVAGSTMSAADFPIVDPFQGGYGGGERDAFFMEVSAFDLSIVQSSFVGGESFDIALGLEVDLLGNIVMGGDTESNAFPVTPNAYQAIKAGSFDGFLMRLTSRVEQPKGQLDWFSPAVPSGTELTPPRGLTAGLGTPPVPPPQNRGGVGTPGAYNVYRSTTPGVVPSAKTYYMTVPSHLTSTGPIVAGGAHFVVTAVYTSGESLPTNEASVAAGEGTIDTVLYRPTKFVIRGSGFTSAATVTLDGIAFSLPCKVKAGGSKVVQKGRLVTGQTPIEYLLAVGGAGVLTVSNANGATATRRIAVGKSR